MRGMAQEMEEEGEERGVNGVEKNRLRWRGRVRTKGRQDSHSARQSRCNLVGVAEVALDGLDKTLGWNPVCAQHSDQCCG